MRGLARLRPDDDSTGVRHGGVPSVDREATDVDVVELPPPPSGYTTSAERSG